MAHLSAYLDTRKVSQGQMEGRGRRRGLWIDAYGLRKACKASGMTQVQVTKAIDVSQNRVSRMESGDMGATGIGSSRRYIAVLGGSLMLATRLPSGDIKFAEGMRTQAQWRGPTARATPTLPWTHRMRGPTAGPPRNMAEPPPPQRSRVGPHHVRERPVAIHQIVPHAKPLSLPEQVPVLISAKGD